MAPKFESVDSYLLSLPAQTRTVVQQMRTHIRAVLPEATETITYDIPTFQIDGRSVVHIAGWKQHVSAYPVPDGDEQFQHDVEPYRAGKGTLKFPLTDPVPMDLVERQVRFLILERH